MAIASLGHSLATLYDGATVFLDGQGKPMPLTTTAVDVKVDAGIAKITTTRTFRNCEEVTIEVVLTIPIGFDAVVTRLSAIIDGRNLIAEAKPKSDARASYEGAIDAGKLAVLHEEVLRGIHVISVAQLAPGKSVEVVIEAVTNVSAHAKGQFLRIPMTAGALYGTSPLLPADDLVVSDAVRFEAALTASCEDGDVSLEGGQLLDQQKATVVSLDQAIHLIIANGKFGKSSGHDASGRKVTLETRLSTVGDSKITAAVLIDHSGSTSFCVRDNRPSIWQSSVTALKDAFAGLRDDDEIALWEFDDKCRLVGEARGAKTNALLPLLTAPRGGTEMAGAILQAVNHGAKDVLVLTDGQAWAHIVNDIGEKGARVSAVLIGKASLDASIGHLCAATGGEVFYAPGEDVGAAVRFALASLRVPGQATQGKIENASVRQLKTVRAGVEISVSWAEETSSEPHDAIGAYTAALALPLLQEGRAALWAAEHGLCSHLTSLVLVDEQSQAVQGLPEMRKVPLAAASAMAHSSNRASLSRNFTSLSAGTETVIHSLQPPSMPAKMRDRRPGSVRDYIVGPEAARHTGERNGEHELQALAARLDWASCANAFLASDFSTISETDAHMLEELAETTHVEALARYLSYSGTLVALAIVATFASEDDRIAARFFRRICGMAPAQMVKAARADILTIH